MRLCALAGLLAAAGPTMAASVTGRVELIDKGGRKATDLSDVVVYLDGVRTRAKPTKVTVTMKGKAFTPHVAVVPVGGTVEFPNDDPIFHNVFSVSADNRFDLSLYKRPSSGAWTFQSAGVVRVYCNIHPQMSAVIVVRDNPYYTKAAADGSFAIEEVPAGSYLLKAWHERSGEAAAPVTVAQGASSTVQLVLDGSSYKRIAHKRKDGTDYDTPEKY